MDSFLPPFLDALLRKHPLVMAALTTALAIVACWALIGSGNSILVYEGF